MIRELRIGNFKAFGPTQTIPIRPLTLIYGPNSGGKSSIIHALALAHEARRRKGDWNVSRTKVGGRSIDLGGFRQYVHGHDIRQMVELGLTIDTAPVAGKVANVHRHRKRLGYDFSKSEKTLSEFCESHADSRLDLVLRVGTDAGRVGGTTPCEPTLWEGTLRLDGHLLLTFARDEATSPFCVEDLDRSHPLFCGAAAADGAAKGHKIEIGGWLPTGPDFEEKWDSVHDLLQAVAGAAGDEMERLTYLGPLRSYPPRHLALSDHRDSNWNAGGGSAWDSVRKEPNLRKRVNEWLGHEWLKTPYRLEVPEMLSISRQDLGKQLRDLVDRLEQDPDGVERDERVKRAARSSRRQAANTRVAQIKEQLAEADARRRLAEDDEEEADPPGDAAANVGDPVAVDGEERLLASATPAEPTRAKLSRRALEDAIHAAAEKTEDLILFDTQKSVAVSHRDVGIGISQVLPVLVYAFGSKEKLIAIEQPEIHIHPALQAELGDVFIESALGDRKNTFIIETHSEHLLLRIMRRMRETQTGRLPSDALAIAPKDVSVMYVEPDGPHSIALEIPLNEQGELVKPWPGGFFEEGLREVFSDAR